MRKIFFLILVVFILSAVAWGGFLYWGQIRGLGPAILPASPSGGPPPSDIGDIIEQTPPEQQNTTDFSLTLPASQRGEPEGFSISVFARDLGPARAMAWDPAGNLLVSVTQEGKVLALPDYNKDGAADRAATVAENLNRPHGLLFSNDKLYIAESDQVATYDYNQQILRASNKEKIIDLPNGGGHFTRTLLKTPNNRLLISVGSTCNVCVESDWRRAAVLISNMDGSNLEVFASGLRNSVFMAVHPKTEDIWVTEMGRDFLGDNLPPDEINILKDDRNYGWPVCYGKNIHDTNFDKNTYIRNPCMEPFEIPSFIDLPAHSAPLGLAFIPADSAWPQNMWDDLLVAYHGSWNREEPTGYKIVRFKLDEHGNYEGVDSTSSPQAEDFISGWLQGDRVLGRSVDILVQPGGVMYISDDHAGVIYRVVYHGK